MLEIAQTYERLAKAAEKQHWSPTLRQFSTTRLNLRRTVAN